MEQKLNNKDFDRVLNVAIDSGLIFGIQDYKKPSGLRVDFNCRGNVQKFLVFKNSTLMEDEDSRVITIYEFNRKGYRSMLRNKINKITFRGFTFVRI